MKETESQLTGLFPSTCLRKDLHPYLYLSWSAVHTHALLPVAPGEGWAGVPQDKQLLVGCSDTRLLTCVSGLCCFWNSGSQAGPGPLNLWTAGSLMLG